MKLGYFRSLFSLGLLLALAPSPQVVFADMDLSPAKAAEYAAVARNAARAAGLALETTKATSDEIEMERQVLLAEEAAQQADNAVRQIHFIATELTSQLNHHRQERVGTNQDLWTTMRNQIHLLVEKIQDAAPEPIETVSRHRILWPTDMSRGYSVYGKDATLEELQTRFTEIARTGILAIHQQILSNLSLGILSLEQARMLSTSLAEAIYSLRVVQTHERTVLSGIGNGFSFPVNQARFNVDVETLAPSINEPALIAAAGSGTQVFRQWIAEQTQIESDLSLIQAIELATRHEVSAAQSLSAQTHGSRELARRSNDPDRIWNDLSALERGITSALSVGLDTQDPKYGEFGPGKGADTLAKITRQLPMAQWTQDLVGLRLRIEQSVGNYLPSTSLAMMATFDRILDTTVSFTTWGGFGRRCFAETRPLFSQVSEPKYRRFGRQPSCMAKLRPTLAEGVGREILTK